MVGVDLITGIRAVHGDDAVAALDNELVDPYRVRPDSDCSLSDSDVTENGRIERKS